MNMLEDIILSSGQITDTGVWKCARSDTTDIYINIHNWEIDLKAQKEMMWAQTVVLQMFLEGSVETCRLF